MNLSFIRGDTVPLAFKINDDVGNLIALEEVDTLILTARQFPSAESRVLFIKNKEDFSIVDGEYRVTLQPKDTENLTIEKFQFDVEVTLTNGTRKTYIHQVKMDRDYTIHGGEE